MSLFEALTLVLIMLPLAAMPSASVVLVVARSARAGRLSGACAALGVVAGDLVFVAMALLGVSVLADWLGALFFVVRVCGGAYLIWLGIGLLRSTAPLALPGNTNSKSSLIADFLAGLLLTLGDVKAILFYASLFPALIDMTRVDAGDVFAIVAITALTVGGVKLTYALFAASLVERLRLRVSSSLPRKLGGALMIGCGSVLIAKG